MAEKLRPSNFPNRRDWPVADDYFGADSPTHGTAGIPGAVLHRLAESIAKQFTTIDSYGARELVTHLGELYRFKVDHPAGAWNAAHVDHVDLSDFGLEGFSVTSNNEYKYAVCDANGVFLFGAKNDGSFEWSKGMSAELRKKLESIFGSLESIFGSLESLAENKVDKEAGKSLIDHAFAEGVSIASNDEYLLVVLDEDGAVLFGVGRDGSFSWSKGLPGFLRAAIDSKQDRKPGRDVIDSEFAAGVKVEANEEYLIAFIDADSNFLFGVRKDGSFSYSSSKQLENLFSGVLRQIEGKADKEVGKSLIDSTFASGVSITSSDEYMLALVDHNGAFLFGIERDGSIAWSKGVPKGVQDALGRVWDAMASKQDYVEGKSVIDAQLADRCYSTPRNPEWFWALLDYVGKVVEGITQDGVHVFRLPIRLDGGVEWTRENLSELQQALKENGFQGGTGDWSDKSSLEIPVPKMAIINFSGISQMPQTKTTNAHAYMEFWDMSGNYFKKKVIVNAQGSSSMKWSKKNVGIDLCNDDWVGDDTFKIKFGEWVPQDSFHIKAYATDYFKCTGLAGYDLVKAVLDTRPLNTTWKQSLAYGDNPIATKSVSPRIDSGALCYPQGFICKVYLNGNFEGLFCFQLKKHRDNYNMNKKTLTNIHIEGMLGASYFWNGNIDWTQFEVRNPKSLITYTGEDYDGDNPTELIDSTSPVYDASNSKHKNTAKVKQYIVDLSQRMVEINNAEAGMQKTLFERYFGLDSCVDYAVLSDAIYNYDYMKNIQWTTWDGEKWFVNFYDMDCTLGANSSADSIHYPTTTHTTTATMHPLKFVVENYTAELEARWAELRNLKIIDPQNIARRIDDYMKTWGADAYAAESAKWPDYPYDRDMVVDSENWQLEVDANGNPVIYTTEYHQWSSSTTYAAGYVVQYNPSTSSQSSQGWWYRFTALQSNTDKKPVTRTGFRDNIFRVYNWLRMQIDNMDSLYNYNA